MRTTTKPAPTAAPRISDRWMGFIILGILALTWGSSFILIKKCLKAYSPVQVACLRLSITALALFPVLWARRGEVEWQRWRMFLAVGLLGTAIPAFLFSFAQQRVSSSVASSSSRRWASSWNIHLLLTDVVLPGQAGPQVAAELSALRPDLRVLFMSGYTDNAIGQHGLLDPSVAFIQKPVTPEALLQKVRAVLG